MRIIIVLSIIGMICHFTSSGNAYGCTAFVLENENGNVLGANYDWDIDVGLLIVNKRGLRKTAIVNQKAKGKPISWVSKYGSVTFNQYGRELPVGGINEAGLVIIGLLLDRSGYPESDTRPYIGKGQWKQYVLDNYETVEEVISKPSPVRVLPPRKSPGLHYFIYDRVGDSAVIEYIGGKQVVFANDSLPAKVITNRLYNECVETFVNNTPFFTDPNRALERFIIAAKAIERYHVKATKSPVESAFEILKKVDQGPRTKWSIVYDLEKMCIYFNTRKGKDRKWIDVNNIDFSCNTNTMVLDVNLEMAGDVTSCFQDYSQSKNFSLIQNAFTNTHFLTKVPQKVILGFSRYPDSFICEN